MLLIVVLVILLFTIIFYYKPIKDHISVVKHIRKLPGPPEINFLVGNISPGIGTPEHVYKFARKWGTEYYPIFKLWAAHRAVASIVNLYDFETILSNPKHITKKDLYENLHQWLGTGLLTSNGSKWQKRRKILTPAFHFSILQGFIEIFAKETKVLVDKLKEESRRPFVPVDQYISDFTLSSIGGELLALLETAMGINFSDKGDRCRRYKAAIYGIADVFIYRLCRPWLSYNFLYFFHPNYFKEWNLVKTLHQFTNDVIAEREKNFERSQVGSYSKRKRLAMLDLLLNAKKEGSVDNEGVREEVDTFMFEGHDTTSSAICSALLLIANHRDIQDRIYEEIQQVSSETDYNTLQKLKYMELCIKEVLRLYPSVLMVARTLGEDITTYSGHLLKAGSIVYLHIMDVQRNPDIYPEPEKFDPERFLPERCRNRHPFAYVPFSAGPRNCIGQKFAMLEIKSALFGILSEFILEPVDTPSSIIPMSDLVFRAKDGIKVKFVPRQ